MGPKVRRYRCTYTPLDRDGHPVPSDTGVLPYVQVQAANAEDAQRLAYATVGCPIAEVQRVEPLPAAAGLVEHTSIDSPLWAEAVDELAHIAEQAPKPDRWPFGTLTDAQLRARAARERALRADHPATLPEALW